MLQDFGLKVVNDVNAILSYWDRDLRCRFANAAYKVWFGKDHEEILGLTMAEVLSEPIFALVQAHARAALEGQPQVFELSRTFPDGRVRYSLASYYPDIQNGVVQGFSVHVSDVTRLKQLELALNLAKERAEALATHDFLTGLPNRLALADRIQTAFARVKRDGRLFGVVAIDIDGFKSIKDTHGHLVGDHVLIQIAARMKSAIRGTDTVTRLGGDEFLFLVDDVDSADGVRTALHRLLEAVCQPMQLGRIRITPSLSCGIAIFPRDGTDEPELMAKADAALYRAKRQGKNCSVFAQPREMTREMTREMPGEKPGDTISSCPTLAPDHSSPSPELPH